MVSAINSALSGLDAASRRIEVAAQNIANQDTTSTKVDGVTTSKPYLPQDIVQVSEAGGGVKAYQRTAANPTVKRYNPEATTPDNEAVEVPNVDDATQLANQQAAAYDYKANLKSIKVASSLEKSLLDIVA